MRFFPPPSDIVLTVEAPPAPGMAEEDDFLRRMLAADWACYPAAADRVDAARLQAAVRASPAGFRLYTAEDQPVGYTGWHPVTEDTFAQLHDAPHTLSGRGGIAPAPMADDAAYVYIFNVSLVPALHRTSASRRMMEDFAATLHALRPRGLAAVTVSEDGARVMKRFGLSRRGALIHDGVAEDVYAAYL